MGEPHASQKLRCTPGEEANSFGCPWVKRNAAFGTITNVATEDEVWRRQLSQWQWTTCVGSPSYSYWILRQRQWPMVDMSMAPVRPLERRRGYAVDTFECAGEVALVGESSRGCRSGRGRALAD